MTTNKSHRTRQLGQRFQSALKVRRKLHRARSTMFSYYIEGYVPGEDGLNDAQRVFTTEIIGAAL